MSEDSKDSKDLSEFFKKDEKYIEELINYIPYRGFAPDRASLFYRTEDKNMVDNGLTIYQCHKKKNHDIYIGPKDMEFKSSFCGTDVSDEEVVSTEEVEDNTKDVEDTKENNKNNIEESEEKTDEKSDNNKKEK
jgi:hypothetical protein